LETARSRLQSNREEDELTTGGRNSNKGDGMRGEEKRGPFQKTGSAQKRASIEELEKGWEKGGQEEIRTRCWGQSTGNRYDGNWGGKKRSKEGEALYWKGSKTIIETGPNPKRVKSRKERK